MSYHLKIYRSASDLPGNWELIVGSYHVMLSGNYVRALQESKPQNMECYLVGFFQENELVGGALFQYLDFIRYQKTTDHHFRMRIKNLAAGMIVKDIMILGNNMLTGQNGFYFDFSKIQSEDAVNLLHKAIRKMQCEIRKTSLIVGKDYQKAFAGKFFGKPEEGYFQFAVQPNMKLAIRESWKTFEDYTDSFSKKYRARAKAAKKKLQNIEKLELNLELIRNYRLEMKRLYQHVAENASFNTFFLAENHFEKMKENLGEQFKVFGYFSEKQMIGFYTLMVNNTDVDTYFLGYDKIHQKEKQIYLNMLLDMVEFAVSHQFKRVVFGRTALEIKSTVGAEPVEIYIFMKHTNSILNKFTDKIFASFAPKTEWTQRKPFKKNPDEL